MDCEFFLIALPGLEDLVADEVREWFPSLEVRQEFGGVTVVAPLSVGLSMNWVLKTPTRVLLRVARFPCRDFPKLFHKISRFAWDDWVDATCTLEVSASTSRSRLKIKKRIEETVEEGWREFQERRGAKANAIANANAKKTLKLLVRMLDDECTLSLDTSGERLHKRGVRTFVGEAPLRETIAAALLQFLSRHALDLPSVEVVDPMMGSGTILLEAALRYSEFSDRRDFALQHFALDRKMVSPQPPPTRRQIVRVRGYEIDKKAFTAAQENFKKIQGSDRGSLEVELNRGAVEAVVNLPAPDPGVQRWLILNPPYGERLKVKDSLSRYYEDLLQHLARFQAQRACLLLPTRGASGRLRLPEGWKVLEKRRFSNGGIPVIAFVFEICSYGRT